MMTYEPSEAVDFRQRLLTSPDERGDVTVTGELILFTLSPRGKAVLEEHRASVMNAIRETMRQLSDEDWRDVSNTLRKLQDTLSKLH